MLADTKLSTSERCDDAKLLGAKCYSFGFGSSTVNQWADPRCVFPQIRSVARPVILAGIFREGLGTKAKTEESAHVSEAQSTAPH